MTKSLPLTIELIFDFVSPNAYLAWFPLKDIAARTGAAIEVTPVFLGGMHKLTGNAPPFIRDAEVKGKNEYAMLEIQRFIAQHDMTDYKMNPKFPFNSITLQRLLCAVNGEERIKMVDALMVAIWHDGIDPTDAAEIVPVLAKAGFDAANLLARTQDPAIKQSLMDNTERAVERGAFGIPTFYINAGGDDEMFFGKERLGQIEAMLSAG